MSGVENEGKPVKVQLVSEDQNDLNLSFLMERVAQRKLIVLVMLVLGVLWGSWSYLKTAPLWKTQVSIERNQFSEYSNYVNSRYVITGEPSLEEAAIHSFKKFMNMLGDQGAENGFTLNKISPNDIYSVSKVSTNKSEIQNVIENFIESVNNKFLSQEEKYLQGIKRVEQENLEKKLSVYTPRNQSDLYYELKAKKAVLSDLSLNFKGIKSYKYVGNINTVEINKKKRIFLLIFGVMAGLFLGAIIALILPNKNL